MPIELLPPPREEKPNLFARRALAYALDLALLYLLTLGTSLFCLYAYATLRHPGDPTALATLAAGARAGYFTKAAHILYYFSYFTILHWYFGRTFGKWATGLRVCSDHGEELGFFRALGRALLYVVSGQLALGVGFLLPLFRKDGRALHDLIAHTRGVDAKGSHAQIENSAEAA
jgi:uncharacterized RDD family membrane protein YckC